MNVHSHHGGDWHRRLETLIGFCLRERPTLIALQEVNQTREAPPLRGAPPRGLAATESPIPLREDNGVLPLAEALYGAGVIESWCWHPVKVGYGIYDEGLALLCAHPLRGVRQIPLSEGYPYSDWRRRAALLARLGDSDSFAVNLHTSRWREGFPAQWERLCAALPKQGTVWLMGDWNCPAEVRGEGYDRVRLSGFHDCFAAAARRTGETTARVGIDGWRDLSPMGRDRLRIDHIFCSRPLSVSHWRTVLDGGETQEVSDHAGVLVETGKKTET